LKHIYKERLPESFEVLDGLIDCTNINLAVFLERVKTFKSNMFVIMNAETLEGGQLETLFSFMSNPGIAAKGISLNLIQRENAMLHTAPWIHGVKWEDDEAGHENKLLWKALIVDQVHIEVVWIVWSHKIGAGKTHHVQNELNSCCIDEFAKVAVHEKSSVASIIRDLENKFSRDLGTKAVHMNFADAPTDQEATHWVADLNHFFLSLVFLRSVRSPVSARSFHLDESNWRIYVELPNHDGDSMSEMITQWLRKNIPVLTLCGTSHSPPICYAIDDKTRRVCAHLRAYDNGTINRKFSVRLQRILFVLDKSGSIEVQMGQSMALSIVTDNALRIFDCHIGIGDMFGVVMCNHAVDVSIPLQPIFDEACRIRMRQTLDSVQHHANGGTAMYTV